VGLVVARVYRQEPRTRVPLVLAMCAWALLSLAPDLDVIGFRFGVRYASPWGHRGASHSIFVALALGSLIGLAASRVGGRGLRMAVFASLVLVSHPLLDMLTDGGLGCAWLWPFDSQRAFAPWSPIPVAPIGKAFWSPAGLRVFLAELVLFSPLLLFAFWPRSRR